MSQNWLTPEEIQRKKEFKKKIVKFSIPVIIMTFSAIMTVLANSL